MGGKMGRLEGQIAIVMGAGQTPGEGIGNGRATSVVFAREGATVVAVDRDLSSAEETLERIVVEGGQGIALRADITEEDEVEGIVAETLRRFGRIDILHNNVGTSLAGGDGPIDAITPEIFDRVTEINLRGMVITCKHVLRVMREQRAGVVVNISSTAVLLDYPNLAYKTSKAGVIALTENIAITGAPYGIRANCILPGLMNTPMAIENRIGREGKTRQEVVSERISRVPLGRMGTGWDTAEAALFLASPQANFITGVSLRIDGGQCLDNQ
jgi:NAD(P)-dependent dehydrogenase (short-subunit alcohol dehydrogenase family)